VKCIKTFFVVSFVALICFTIGTNAGVCAPVACADIKTQYDQYFKDLEFGKPITISSSAIATAGSAEVCDIRGTIWPEIKFALKVPTATYNNRLVMVGTGGTAGSIGESSMPTYLQKGFAALATDTGHPSPGMGKPELWAITSETNPNADQKVKDYAYRANHEVPSLAKKILEVHRGALPLYSYWVGCSNGGREGLVSAQRYPEDFDGYIANSPPVNLARAMMGFIWKGLKFQNLDPTKLCLQAKYVYNKCDGIDGLVDGLIENPSACTFNPMVDLPACPNDADAANCFTLKQRTAIKDIYGGPVTSWGEQINVPMQPGAEVCSDPTKYSTSNWSRMYTSINTAQGTLGYLTLRDPSFNASLFNFDTDTFKVLERPETAWMAADDPDLRSAKNLGRKMISVYGWSESQDPNISVKYYESVLDFMGEGNVKDFYKLYLVPGMFHCGGGVGCSATDFFTPLQNWVEKGIEPKSVIGTSTPTAYLPNVRTRPICPYPQVSRYIGGGSIDDAANFVCAETMKADVSIQPDPLSLSSSKPYFTATIELSHQGDWRSTSAVCEGATATSLVRHGHSYTATFNKADLKNITVGDSVAFTVTLFVEHQGNHNGNPDNVCIVFEGSDTVKVTQ
jgi:hypothetical protein